MLVALLTLSLYKPLAVVLDYYKQNPEERQVDAAWDIRVARPSPRQSHWSKNPCQTFPDYESEKDPEPHCKVAPRQVTSSSRFGTC